MKNFLKRLNQKDRSQGFNPETYNKLLMNEGEGSWQGLDHARLSGRECRYCVFDLYLREHGQSQSQTYLRGFEQRQTSHDILAYSFLKELNGTLGFDFGLPILWSEDARGRSVKEFSAENNGVKLTVRCLGGGKYKFKEDGADLRVYSDSHSFGKVEPSRQQGVLSLFDKLRERESHINASEEAK